MGDRTSRRLLLAAFLRLVPCLLWAATVGSISGDTQGKQGFPQVP